MNETQSSQGDAWFCREWNFISELHLLIIALLCYSNVIESSHLANLQSFPATCVCSMWQTSQKMWLDSSTKHCQNYWCCDLILPWFWMSTLGMNKLKDYPNVSWKILDYYDASFMEYGIAPHILEYWGDYHESMRIDISKMFKNYYERSIVLVLSLSFLSLLTFNCIPTYKAPIRPQNFSVL